jgi:predicted Zn-dependent peptidase
MKHTIKQIKLKNSATLVLIDVPESPVFNIDFCFRAGDYYTKNDNLLEAAHLMEHLALGANSKQRSSKKASEEISKNGANFNAYTGFKNLGYTVYGPDFDTKRILKQMILQLNEPLFLEKEFKAEWGNVREETQLRSNNNWSTLFQVQSTKMGFPKNQTYQERYHLMENIKLNDLIEYRNRTHSTKNLIIYLALDTKKFAQAEIINLLETLNLPGNKKLARPPVITPKKIKEAIIIPKQDIENIYFNLELFNFSDHRITDQESSCLSIINYILTGSLHSIILGKARDKGLIYDMSSSFSASLSRLNLNIGGQVSHQKIAELFKLISLELTRILKNGFNQKEWQQVKNEFLGSLRMSFQTTNDLFYWHQRHYDKDAKIRSTDDIAKHYQDCTKEQALLILKQLFNKPIYSIAYLGNIDADSANAWRKILTDILN